MAAPRPKGNDRTDQAARFTIYDTTIKTQHMSNAAQADAETKADMAASRLDGHMDMTNLSERWGRAIQVKQFIGLLKKLNPALIFELSKNYPDKYAIYIERPKIDPLTKQEVGRTKRHIVGLESGSRFGGILVGYMPEFSILVNDTEEIPDHEATKKVKRFRYEIRGWRTVLAALIMEQLITEAQAEQTFHISQGKDSFNWQNRMQKSILLTDLT